MAILLWCSMVSGGCCPPVVPDGSPHLPPLPEPLTQAEVDETMRTGGVAAVAALYGTRYLKTRNALEATVLEGAWAEDAAERQRLLQAPARPTAAPAGSRAPGG